MAEFHGGNTESLFVVRLNHPGSKLQTFSAAQVAIHGEHLVLLDSRGKLVALFLSVLVEGWSQLRLGLTDPHALC